jgi:hypothetical protein
VSEAEDEESFKFVSFNVLKVLAHASPLLGSSGLEYDLDAATMALDPKSRLKKQRQLLKSQLAHGDADAEERGGAAFEGLLDADDLVGRNSPVLLRLRFLLLEACRWRRS